MGVLKELVAEDFGITGAGRWLKSIEHDSLVVDNYRDIFFWNSRGLAGDALEYLMKVRGLSYRDSLDFLKGMKSAKAFLFLDLNTDRSDDKKGEIVINPNLVEIFYENGEQNDTSYWDARGIKPEFRKVYKLGFTGEFFTIPLYDLKGNFRNFMLRRDNPKKIRLFYPLHEHYIFNTDLFSIFKPKKVFITEGIPDAIRLFQEGVLTVSHTLGANGWDLQWNQIFDGVKKVYILYDNDSAGWIGSLKLAKHLGLDRCFIYNFFDFPEKTDVISYFNSGGDIDYLLSIVEKNAKLPSELEGITRKRYLTK